MNKRGESKLVKSVHTHIIEGLILPKNKGDELRLVLTVSEVATLLRINKAKIYKMAKTNTIPNLRDGNRILIPISALVDWLERVAWEGVA